MKNKLQEITADIDTTPPNTLAILAILKINELIKAVNKLNKKLKI